MEKTFENWLVVSDIDGTLNNKMRRLPKRNYDAIKRFTELGGNFTLASGRLQSSLERNYNRITPNQPAVILNGAGIYDYNKRMKIWKERGFNYEQFKDSSICEMGWRKKTAFNTDKRKNAKIL